MTFAARRRGAAAGDRAGRASASTPGPARSSPSSAPAAAARRRCSSSSAGSSSPTPAARAPTPAALMAQRDLLLPWARRRRQRRARAARGGCRPRRGSCAGERAAARLRAGGLRARAPLRALRRDAPAGGVRSHAAVGLHGAVPRRAVRVAGRAHPPGHAGLARRHAGQRSRARSCSSPTTSRRRSCSPTGSYVFSPRPGRIVATLDVDVSRPRKRTVSRLVALRERALEALRA